MLAEYLHTRHVDTHIGSYYALDHSVQAQARELRGNIQFKKDQYAQQHIRLSRVDIIAHSMGGLLSRFYTNNASYYQKDVRKLLIVETPNQVCMNVCKTKAVERNSFPKHLEPEAWHFCIYPGTTSTSDSTAYSSHPKSLSFNLDTFFHRIIGYLVHPFPVWCFTIYLEYTC
jgi:hypothetical protein